VVGHSRDSHKTAWFFDPLEFFCFLIVNTILVIRVGARDGFQWRSFISALMQEFAADLVNKVMMISR